MKNKVFAIFIITSLLFIQFIQGHSALASQGAQANIDLNQALEEAKLFCKQKVDPMIANMAKQAGYDVEKLCKSLNQFSLSGEQIEEIEIPERSLEATNNAQENPQNTNANQEKGENLLDQPDQSENTPLKLFGYDLFAGEPATFQPNTHAPIEPDYLLGPGDQLNIQFYGKVNDYFEQNILRDGSISFPKIGPIGVAGMNFSDVKKLINRKVAEEYIGVKVSVSLGALRSIQVFVFGEAYKPGRYTVPSLSTITNVLYLSGGVSEIASLRNIQIKRDGKIQAVFDLYDLLLNGDRSGDIRLQAGDTIFIPTIGQTASIDGQIRRPAIYEIKKKPTVGKLIELSGGLLPKAFQAKARIKRVDNLGFMTVVDIDLKTNKGRDTKLKNGDLLVVDAVADASNNVVTLSGNVYHPGESLWKQNLRVTDLIPSSNHLMPNTDLNFALLRRELKPSGAITTLFIPLMDILSNPESPLNYSLQPRDELVVFGAQEETRAESLGELVMLLKQQSRIGEVAKIVTISGAVQSPGSYPMTENMSLTQLIAFSGGMKEQAYNQSIELTRSDFSDRKKVVVSHQTINLSSILSGEQADIKLNPYDQINIRALADYREIMTVKIEGEVLLPGDYSILENETLSSVIARAGGLTNTAHVAAAIFTRETLRQREIQKIEILRDQLQSDLASINLKDGKSVTKESEQKILSQLDKEKALGRLVIDLEAIIQGKVPDIALRDGDYLVIPELRQEVAVMGEVPWPSAHQYNDKLRIDDYLELAGGIKPSADKTRIYVVKVNGSVRIPKHSGWPRWGNFKIEPGDTVVVPMDMDRQSSLSLWSEVTRIIYQLSLGAAAIKNL
ncbi:MAG: SLBB domain-containing protein [Porticoccaceae bacterium]|nr:SLBB domain-containing protein [Porticoccaceae bacterium]